MAGTFFTIEPPGKPRGVCFSKLHRDSAHQVCTCGIINVQEEYIFLFHEGDPEHFNCFPHTGFPGGSDGKGSTCNSGDPGLIPGLGRSPREGSGNPLQYSCLENPMDRGV